MSTVSIIPFFTSGPCSVFGSSRFRILVVGNVRCSIFVSVIDQLITSLRPVLENPHSSAVFSISAWRFAHLLGYSGSYVYLMYNEQGIDIARNRAGRSDIAHEYTSAHENPRFILHDSQGFEPGFTKNWDVVEEFIRDRCGRLRPKDRLHAIW
jgi:hypothetical protein